jgi:uncharacterized protein YbaP (TraB family)
MRAAIVLALALCACAGSTPAPQCAAYTPIAPGRPFLWRVTGPHGSLTIAATHQAAGQKDVPAAAWAELDRADMYVSEADENNDVAMEDMRELFFLPRGESLVKLLGDGDYSELRSHVSADDLNHMKPWVAMTLLASRTYPFPSHNISAVLLDRAKTGKKPIEFLDTWQDQAAYLDAAVTPAVLAKMIHNYPRLGCETATRVAAFRAGDDAVFANEIANEHQPIVTRINAWFAQLDGYVAQGRHAFVAIGIGHLVGPYGLLVQFAARGYKVERL